MTMNTIIPCKLSDCLSPKRLHTRITIICKECLCYMWIFSNQEVVVKYFQYTFILNLCSLISFPFAITATVAGISLTVSCLRATRASGGTSVSGLSVMRKKSPPASTATPSYTKSVLPSLRASLTFFWMKDLPSRISG